MPSDKKDKKSKKGKRDKEKTIKKKKKKDGGEKDDKPKPKKVTSTGKAKVNTTVIDNLIKKIDNPYHFASEVTEYLSGRNLHPVIFCYVPNMESSLDIKKSKSLPWVRVIETDGNPRSTHSLCKIVMFSDSALNKKTLKVLVTNFASEGSSV